VQIREVEVGERAELEHSHIAKASEEITLRVLSGADYLALRQHVIPTR